MKISVARRCVALAVAVLGCITAAPIAAGDASPATTAGTTVVGEQDAAVGLFLAPWKNESRGELDRPPGLLDPDFAPVDAVGYARSAEHYASGRAYRAERLLRAR